MTGFSGKWQHAWTLPIVGLSVRHWQWKQKLWDTENPRDMQGKDQIKDLRRGRGW
jgi:hypothetical protein